MALRRCSYTRCRLPVTRGQAWDLGHNDRRDGYNGPEHASCNRKAGAANSNRMREHWNKQTGNNVATAGRVSLLLLRHVDHSVDQFSVVRDDLRAAGLQAGRQHAVVLCELVGQNLELADRLGARHALIGLIHRTLDFGVHDRIAGQRRQVGLLLSAL